MRKRVRGSSPRHGLGSEIAPEPSSDGTGLVSGESTVLEGRRGQILDRDSAPPELPGVSLDDGSGDRRARMMAVDAAVDRPDVVAEGTAPHLDVGQ